MSALEFFEWLGNTPGSTAILESLWVYPAIETTHVLTLCLFLGLIAMLDLRLVGLTLKDVPASDVAERLLPWARVGFAVMVVSGLLLFYSSPVRAFENIFFRIKVVLLILAGINVFVFHSTVYKHVSEWDVAPRPPARARMAGYLSLTLWAGVVVAGRMQAYNWFQ